jgi:hypothetical protein
MVEGERERARERERERESSFNQEFTLQITDPSCDNVISPFMRTEFT